MSYQFYDIFYMIEGTYLMEVDRVLRPGGYWILSGPPINWKTYYQTWKRPKEELQAEQRKIEELAEQLCWEKKYEKGDLAIWRKKVNDRSCQRKDAPICQTKDADDVWLVFNTHPLKSYNQSTFGGAQAHMRERETLWTAQIMLLLLKHSMLESNLTS